MGLGKLISYATKWNPATWLGCAAQYYGRNGTVEGFWDNYKQQVEALENDEFGDIVDNAAAMTRGVARATKDAGNAIATPRNLIVVGGVILAVYLCSRRCFK